MSIASSIERLVQLRDKLIEASNDAISKDPHHKSSECWLKIDIEFPNMFDDDQEPTVHVAVYSYLIGPARMHYWESADKAIEDIEKWLKDYWDNE